MNAILIISVGVLATFFTRFIPFWMIGDKHLDHPMLIRLSNVLPSAAISLLIVYVYRNVSISHDTFAPTLIASLCVIILHLIFKKSLLSIVLGTILYMILI